jgi:hypothetical protein
MTDNRSDESPVNPYESPSAAPGQPSTSWREAAVRWEWLVSTSLILAVLIEVLPTEADVLFIALLHKDVSRFLVAKAVCVAVVLAPLVLYVAINGRRGVMAAKRKILVIGVIVVLKLALDVYALTSHLLHR